MGYMDNFNNNNMLDFVGSFLNAGYYAIVIVDRSNFKILHQNKKAIELIGDKTDGLCFEIFKSQDEACKRCIINTAVENSLIGYYSPIFGSEIVWHCSNVKWIDGKDVALFTLLEADEDYSMSIPIAKYHNIDKNAIMSKLSYRIKLDGLTQIPNFAQFVVNVEKIIKTNTDKKYSIVAFDINRFKTINDIYGITIADDVLKSVGEILEVTFDKQGNYGRLHSDVFAFCMEFTKKGDIIKMIEKIRMNINNKKFDFEVDTSYGIYIVDDRNVPVNLMCDRAVMAYKTTIKDDIMRFCAFYDEQYRADIIKAREIENEMYAALEERQFVMYLQPKYMLSDFSLYGAEALVRWVHPTKGIIPPNDFIPLFEKNGFIIKLDEFMWEEACKTIRGWIDEGRKPVPISVNISRYHLKNNDLQAVLTNLINKYDLTPDMLNLEITESIFLDKPEELNRVLVKLQKLGFKLEIDDFGSGFSSLNFIRNISVDTIKIDREFLDSEIATEKGKIVVNHTIAMAKDLMLSVVAEGVESQEHVDFLKSSKCDIAQGYYFARPMPLADFNKLEV